MSETQTEKWRKKLGKKEMVRWLRDRREERAASAKHSTTIMLTTMPQLLIGH